MVGNLPLRRDLRLDRRRPFSDAGLGPSRLHRHVSQKAVAALFGLGVVGYFGYTNSVTHVAYLVFQYAVIILLIFRYEYLEDTVARTFAYLRRL